MTEAEWQTATEPSRMLSFVSSSMSDTGTNSDRKLRLFACACCRRVWDELSDPRSRRAVEVAERHADGRATEEELEAASEAASAAWDEEYDWDAWERAVRGEEGMASPFPPSAAAYNAAIPVGWWGGAPAFVSPDEIIRQSVPAGRDEGAAQCALIREIFGNPFRPLSIDPACLTPRIVALSRAIYDDRDFSRMPTLGNELAATGCTDSELLHHCREPLAHARGCWALDAILGKG